MAAKQYRVLKRSFINDRLVEPGEIVVYDGKPGSNLEAVDAKGVKDAPSKRDIAPHNTAPNGPAAEPASPLPVEPLA
jgi:hypothetical protein